MGYNTVAVFFNDATGLIRQDGPIGARIAQAMMGWGCRPRSERTDVSNFGVGAVISQDHADSAQVVIVARNSGVTAREAKDLDPWALEQMADCLKRHGYTASRSGSMRRKPVQVNQGASEAAGA